MLRALATDWFKAEQNIVARLALLQIEALRRQYILTHAPSGELDAQQLAKWERAFKKYGQSRSNCRSALGNIACRRVAEAISNGICVFGCVQSASSTATRPSMSGAHSLRRGSCSCIATSTSC